MRRIRESVGENQKKNAERKRREREAQPRVFPKFRDCFTKEKCRKNNQAAENLVQAESKLDELQLKHDKVALRQALEKLPSREKEIVTMRYGLRGRKEMTQKEVAQIMGISQSYISRLEKRIMLRLKKELLRQTNCA